LIVFGRDVQNGTESTQLLVHFVLETFCLVVSTITVPPCLPYSPFFLDASIHTTFSLEDATAERGRRAAMGLDPWPHTFAVSSCSLFGDSSYRINVSASVGRCVILLPDEPAVMN
jgi:hypothetical protein